MTQEQLIPKLERALAELPAFPKSVQKIMEMSSDIDCMPRDLVDILEKDPVLTGRILNLVNSAYFALARRVNSIRHALVYLGLNTIKHMAMGLAAVGAMPKVNKDGQSMNSFQSEALACGEVTRITGQHFMARGPIPDQLYLLGLFHNLGDVMCAVYATKEWARYTAARDDLTQEEWDQLAIELFGATPRHITARVLRHWEIAPEICEAVTTYPLSHLNKDAAVHEKSLWIALKFLYEARAPLHHPIIFPDEGSPELERILALLLEYRRDVIESVEVTERFLTESKTG